VAHKQPLLYNNPSLHAKTCQLAFDTQSLASSYDGCYLYVCLIDRCGVSHSLTRMNMEISPCVKRIDANKSSTDLTIISHIAASRLAHTGCRLLWT